MPDLIPKNSSNSQNANQPRTDFSIPINNSADNQQPTSAGGSDDFWANTPQNKISDKTDLSDPLTAPKKFKLPTQIGVPTNNSPSTPPTSPTNNNSANVTQTTNQPVTNDPRLTAQETIEAREAQKIFQEGMLTVRHHCTGSLCYQSELFTTW